MPKKQTLWSVLLLAIILQTCSYAKPHFKSYDMKSAIIHYEISGSGPVSEKSYLEIKGCSTLLFSDWGKRKLYKEKYSEEFTGAIKSTKTVRTLYLEENGTIYSVDFDKERINKHDDPVIKSAIKEGRDLYASSMRELEAKGKKVGTSVALGYTCDVWKFNGKKRCIYKGIPLKEESTYKGIDLVKVAVKIGYDEEVPNDAFVLPTFTHDDPVGYFLKEKNVGSVHRIDDADADADALEIFKLQKELLPKLLDEMREARICLENADDRNEANRCIDNMIEIEEALSGEEDKESEILIWTRPAREKVLNELEENIMDMKRRLPCIRRSQNNDDLAKCMEQVQ